MRTRDHASKNALVAEVEREIGPMLAAGKFSPNVFRSIPLPEAAAHRLMEAAAIWEKLF